MAAAVAAALSRKLRASRASLSRLVKVGVGRRFCQMEVVESKRMFNPSYFVHFGNVVALAALSQSDMLNLRCLLAVSTTCGISYNLLQPKPLIPPALWGCTFLTLHVYMIAMLLRERRELTLTADEELVYEQAFLPYGFTPRQFRDLLSSASPRWCSWQRGDYIRRRGGEMFEMNYLVEGEAEVLSFTDDVLHGVLPGKGGWLGEFFDPNQADDHWDKPRQSPISFRCRSEKCRTLALDRRVTHRMLKGNPSLQQAAARAALADTWGKMCRVVPDMRKSAYRSMLEVSLIDGRLDPGERQLLADFRQRHKISEEIHQKALEELGWSSEEFAAGHRGKQSSWFRRSDPAVAVPGLQDG